MKNRLFEALKKNTADYADIRFEHNDATVISCRGPEIDNVSSSKLSGGIVRACTKGGWGMTTFDSLDEMEIALREAGEAAALVGRERTELAEIDRTVDAVVPVKMVRDFRGIKLDEKINLLKGYNDIILQADPQIATSNILYRDTFRQVHFASSRGNYFREERPRVILSFSAIAADGSLVQRAYDGVSSTVDYGVVVGREKMVEDTARRAVSLLQAPPCEGGIYTVILDPEMGGVFAHEAFGHLSEADFLYENPKMRELMTIGREMGVKQLNIVDDGSRGSLLGTQAFDDEGTPTGKTYLIKEGTLVGHLHSLETAAKMGERPTGNARAIGRGLPPIVRMTNTYIEGGRLSFDELISGVDRGIYALGMMGGQTMMEMFTFTAAYGYRIENGKVGELVRDLQLTGNVFQTLYHIDGFGNDFRILEKGGGCGKGEQSPLPVTDGAPHLRIRDVVVGGK